MKLAISGRFALALAAAGGAIAMPVLLPAPAQAQFSDAYNFLHGVRERDYTQVSGLVEAPGSTVINVRDRDTGEAALHIVVRRRDTDWLLYLLRNNANPNIRDNDGNTPMHISAQIGFIEGIHWLHVVQADINAANNRGETPLILAVHQRNAEAVRQLVDAGANPRIADSVVGMSAIDYARRDSRGTNILQILESAPEASPSQNAVGPVIN